jgi:hypothetical protein
MGVGRTCHEKLPSHFSEFFFNGDYPTWMISSFNEDFQRAKARNFF